MNYVVILWTCHKCGIIHSIVRNSSEPEYEQTRADFIVDCELHGEPWQILPLNLTENAEKVAQKNILDAFLDHMFGKN